MKNFVNIYGLGDVYAKLTFETTELSNGERAVLVGTAKNRMYPLRKWDIDEAMQLLHDAYAWIEGDFEDEDLDGNGWRHEE